MSSIPPIEADAPNVVWAIDFPFDSTIDGQAIKIASMVDEHTRESMLNIVERSSPPNCSLPNSRRCSPSLAGRRRCCGCLALNVEISREDDVHSAPTRDARQAGSSAYGILNKGRTN